MQWRKREVVGGVEKASGVREIEYAMVKVALRDGTGLEPAPGTGGALRAPEAAEGAVGDPRRQTREGSVAVAGTVVASPTESTVVLACVLAYVMALPTAELPRGDVRGRGLGWRRRMRMWRKRRRRRRRRRMWQRGREVLPGAIQLLFKFL